MATPNVASFTAGSGYALTDFVPAEPNTKLISEQRIQPTAGSASASASLASSDNWGAVLIAVKAAAPTGTAGPKITSLSPTSGSIGAPVTITGTNFGETQGSSTVKFNGTAAAPTSWSASNIVAPVPNGATTGNLIVTVGGVTSNAVTFTVTSSPRAPTITGQPSNQTVTAGQSATFSVTASGSAPLSYQWSKNGSAIAGATFATYTTPATTTSDSGSTFGVVVNNSAGTASSSAATLTVNAAATAPSITAQPSNQTVTAGQGATFSVTATGTAPVSYQWRKNGSNITGATSSSYTTPATTTADDGSTFDVVVSNSAGSATSNPATLTVSPASAPAITSLAPTSGSVGTAVTITGNNFGASQGSSTVAFNGADAVPASWSDTTIVAPVPAGANTGDVVVTVAGVPSNGMTFTVTSSGSSPGWTWVQDSPLVFCQGANKSGCNVTLGNITPTVAGSVWILEIQTPNNVTISSVSGGGGTWVRCPNCHSVNNSSVDAWYNLSGNAGVTQGISFTLSGNAGAYLGATFIEVLPPPGTTPAYDDSGSSIQSNCTTCSAVTLSNITGTDAIIRNDGGAAPVQWNSWSAPYMTDSNGFAIGLNVTSGTGPTVTYSRVSNPEYMAIAFKSSAGNFTPPTHQYSIVNFSVAAFGSCGTCTVTIPTTGANHLLYIESADEVFSHITTVSGAGSWTIPSGSNTCQIQFNIMGQNNAASCAYNLSSTVGATSLTITMSGNGATNFAIWEIAATSGNFAFDTQSSYVNTSTPNLWYPAGSSLTLNYSNDVVFQFAWAVGGSLGPSYFGQPYINAVGTIIGPFNYFLQNEAAVTVLLDSGPNPPTPIWINDNPNNAMFFSGVAFAAQ